MAARGIRECFSPEEIARLEDGLPRLKEWSAHILVPFPGYRVRNARVVWLNRRWFGERLFNLTDSSVYGRVCDWILGEFAYISPRKDDRDEILTHDERTLFADRYGSSDGHATHGGSGRVAVTECFQVKGIGQTPLVSPYAANGHSHGCMSMAEAIREAIFAEIASAEFPHGAVPIIAIVDLGLNFSSPNPDDEYDQNVRRAIVVRPAAIRIAHAERAPLFKTSVTVTGFANVQATDVLRTREVIGKWMADATADMRSMEATAVRSLLDAIVEQIAFGQVHRIFSGGYFSSNLTIAGELLDFGNMHALPGWSRAQVHRVVKGFGHEMSVLRNLVNSVTFYVAKYGHCRNGIQMMINLYDGLQASYRAAWKKYCLAILQAEDLHATARDALHESLWRYYCEQQRNTVKYRFGQIQSHRSKAAPGWIYEELIEREPGVGAKPEREMLEGLDQVLKQNVSREQRIIAWLTAARLLRPRSTLDRVKLLTELANLTGDSSPSLTPELVEGYIQKTVDEGRRHWQRLPPGLGVLAHTTRDGSSALLVTNGGERHDTVWIEGVIGAENTLMFFDQQLSEGDGAELGAKRQQRYWSAVARIKEDQGQRYVELPTRKVVIPPMTVAYDAPHSKWLS